MELKFKLYPRGFLFTDFKTDKVPDYYSEKKVLDSFYYYKSNDVDNHYLEDDQYFVIIHGHFTYVEPKKELKRKDLAQYLLSNYKENYSAFLNALDFLAGRYVIIIGNSNDIRFYPDASSTRSVYYTLNNNIVSSHAHFINDVCEHTADEVANNIQAYKINWNHSPYQNIKALTPNLYLDFFKKETKRFFPRSDNKYTHLEENERFELIENMWKNQYAYYFSKFNQFAFSITGGWDSRVSLAMFKDKIDNIDFFTYTTHQKNEEQDKNKNLMLNDGYKVRELLSDVPLNHRFIIAEEVPKKLSDKDREVVFKNIVNKHNTGFLRIYKTFFPGENALHIRSNLHEIGRAIVLPPKNTPNTVERLRSYYINTFNRLNKNDLENYHLDVESFTDQGINDLHLDDETYDYHKMELFYWENRMGRWHSEIMNETDVCFETFSPYNLRAIIDITLSFDFKQRKENYVFAELINRNYPVLNFYGKNEISNLYENNKSLLEQVENQSDSYNDLIKQSRKSSERIQERISGLKKFPFSENQKIKNSLDKIRSMNLENIDIMSEKIKERKDGIERYFNEFTSGNEDEKYMVQVVKQNTLYIDSYISSDIYYAEVKHTFNNEFGLLELVLKGEYHIDYEAWCEILVNDEVVLTQRLSQWDGKNSLNIFNLTPKDTITISLKMEKEVTVNYSNSPKLTVLELNEVRQSKPQSVKITSTSPTADIIHKY
ncbi:hypothetical protein [Salinicoccus albus]|uniref:hypothetical protein n=1 Tax=Salinicoccus albus TaxID=418756 RepID=UPI00036732AE|nr:hypothetical protein [Salinicoccus albus]